MTNNEKLAAIESLTSVLAEKTTHYNELLKKDEILEVRKEMRTQIKEIQRQIGELKDSVDGELRQQ